MASRRVVAVVSVVVVLVAVVAAATFTLLGPDRRASAAQVAPGVSSSESVGGSTVRPTVRPTTPASPSEVSGSAVPASEQPLLPAPEPFSPSSASAPGSLTQVDVVVTFSGWNPITSVAEVGGYVDGITESGGTCTLVLSQGARILSVQIPALPDSTTTSCGGAQVPGAQLGHGSWRASLSYLSPGFSGTSPTSTIEVP